VGPFPNQLNFGPLHFYLYGLGLGIAASVAYYYAKRRLSRVGINAERFWVFATGIIIAGVLGARIAHVVTNWGYYQHSPGQWLALWNGGLASFGGIALAIPVGLVLRHRIWPDSSQLAFLDALLPALLLGWAIGRLLGPQFMYAGGGHITHQWFGFYYHGQVGKRVPVPIIQGIEDALIWIGALSLEKKFSRPGVIAGYAMLIWGVVRSLDEYLLLGQNSHSGSIGVQLSGILLALVGAIILLRAAKN